MKTKHLNQEQILMDAFDFNLRDLHANREGRITKTHGRRIILRELRISYLVAILFIGIFFLCIAPIVIISISDYELFGFLGILAISFGIAGIPMIGKVFSTNHDVNSGTVATIQGLIIVNITPQISIVKIGNLKLRAHRNAVLTLKHMEPYVIHYLPKSKVIVSVEVMHS